MGRIQKINIPRPGLRIIKTAIAVILCILFYQYVERSGLILAAIAALICMQDSVEKSIHEGRNRMIGTTLGGFLGVLFIYFPFFKVNYFLWIFLVFLGIISLIYCFNLLRIHDSIIIGSVVFLVIVLDAEGSAYATPMLYAVNRILDTFIGIILATLVNYFLFRPQPERIAGDDLIELDYQIIKAGKQKISDWSGGTTTELFIYPEDRFYGDREFDWRISTSKSLSRSTVFTRLPGYTRWIMLLEGRMGLDHHNHHRITLNPFDQDYFDGKWMTKSYGICTDFNLMLKESHEGKLSTIIAGSKHNFDPHVFTSFYIIEDLVTLSIESGTEKIVVEDLSKHDFILFYPLEKECPEEITVQIENQNSASEIVAVETIVFPQKD